MKGKKINRYRLRRCIGLSRRRNRRLLSCRVSYRSRRNRWRIVKNKFSWFRLISWNKMLILFSSCISRVSKFKCWNKRKYQREIAWYKMRSIRSKICIKLISNFNWDKLLNNMSYKLNNLRSNISQNYSRRLEWKIKFWMNKYKQ